MMKENGKMFCVVSHTHWDREWYQPHEVFRHRLIDLIDRLLVILAEQPNYVFHLDAQTVVLEDYLAVCPDKKDLLRQHITEGRIIIGPWYLQNDFYIPSGESTIRNLLEGARLCREFGGCSQVGYAADQFGNISQLPQILRGFGLDNFVFGRGFSRVEMQEDGSYTPLTTPTEFIWRGADGSELLAIHMRHWYNNAQRFSADIDKAERYLRMIADRYDNEFTLTPYILLMNGVDHLEAQPDLLPILDALQQRLDEGETIKQYRLDDYVAATAAYVREQAVPLEAVTGEMRCDKGLTTLQCTLSSRSYLKIANAEAQILLENRLEPLYSMMELEGMHGVYPYDRFRFAWKSLIRNHPHDSICGCSHDAVHAHMENRYAELREFSEELWRRGMLTAAEHTAAARGAGERDYIITVANTLSVPQNGMIEVDARILVSDDMERFTILDEQGQTVDYAVLSKERGICDVVSPFNLPGWLDVWQYRLYLDVGTVQPYAFKSFIITAADTMPAITPVVRQAAATTVSNGLLTLAVSADGSVDITDERNGRVLRDCLRLEDVADIGDSYAFKPIEDTPIFSDACRKSVQVVENNDYVSTITITYAMDLPRALDHSVRQRTPDTVTSTVELSLTLRRGIPYVEMAYAVDNASCDHRLRLCVDTDVSPVESYADTPFDIVRRTNDMHYPDTPARIEPNTSFAALQQDGRGVAVLTVGAHEYEHPEGALHRLAFTLVRSTGVIADYVKSWVAPDNQCLRRVSGRLAICPFEGDLVSADIPNMSLMFRAPLATVCTSCDGRKFAGGRPCVQDTTLAEYFYVPDSHPQVAIPNDRSAVRVEGDGVCVSALKLSEDCSGIVLRLYNYTEAATDVTVYAAGAICRTQLDEIARDPLGRDAVSLSVEPKQIVTLYCQRG